MPDSGPSRRNKSIFITAKLYNGAAVDHTPKIIRGQERGNIEDFKEVHNGVIVYPRLLVPNRTPVRMPHWLRTDALIRLDAAEEGGGEAYGTASVVCDTKGNPLKPYKHSNEPNGRHALFSLPESIIRVSVYCTGFIVDIVRYNLVPIFGQALLPQPEMKTTHAYPCLWLCTHCKREVTIPKIKDRSLRQCCPDCNEQTLVPTDLKLPKEFRRFIPAIMAARTKVQCKNCQHTHFEKSA